jgi:hypothetical protein
MNIPNDYKIVKILIADSITLQYCLENCLNNAFEIFRQSKILLNAGDACYWFRQDNNVPQVGWVQLPTWIYFEQFVWDGRRKGKSDYCNYPKHDLKHSRNS